MQVNENGGSASFSMSADGKVMNDLAENDDQKLDDLVREGDQQALA